MAKKCPKTREYVMNFHCVCVFPARQTLRNVTHEIFFSSQKDVGHVSKFKTSRVSSTVQSWCYVRTYYESGAKLCRSRENSRANFLKNSYLHNGYNFIRILMYCKNNKTPYMIYRIHVLSDRLRVILRYYKTTFTSRFLHSFSHTL